MYAGYCNKEGSVIGKLFQTLWGKREQKSSMLILRVNESLKPQSFRDSLCELTSLEKRSVSQLLSLHYLLSCSSPVQREAGLT